MAHHDDHSTPHGTTPPLQAGAPHGMSPFTRLFIYAVIVADLFAVVYFGGTLLVTGSLITPAAKPHLVVAGAETTPETGTAAATAAQPAFDLASYTADPVKGAQVAAKCKACHTFESGGPNRTGPNLFAIVGAPVEHKADFSYSDAMTKHKTEISTWTEANLFAFLENPKAVVPGTKMTFNGVHDPRERADLVAWLKTLN